MKIQEVLEWADNADLLDLSSWECDNIKALAAEVRRLQDANLRIVRGEFAQICSYCGWESADGGWEELQQHIHECSEHPVSKLNAKLSRYQAVVDAATELYALVKGECPALLDEDRGGCSRLDIQLADAFAALDKEEDTPCHTKE